MRGHAMTLGLMLGAAALAPLPGAEGADFELTEDGWVRTEQPADHRLARADGQQQQQQDQRQQDQRQQGRQQQQQAQGSGGSYDLQAMAPAVGYLKARQDLQQPFELLGGPISLTISQDAGGVHVALPDQRELDERVFGKPGMPMAFAGTPLITGLPPELRGTEGDQYTTAQKASPFGNKNMVMRNGTLSLEARDVTATDAAVSDDSVSLDASWEDDAGNTYRVTSDEVITQGVEYPVFGGVVTNHILHGFSGVGTPLMPSEFGYAAFWGKGTVYKNGKVQDENRIVHGMLTEMVRLEDYELAFDETVEPTQRHFHLLVVPANAVQGQHAFQAAPVNTGFTLPNGEQLPFWHVMFNNLDIQAQRD
jgi:hypothetical protein